MIGNLLNYYQEGLYIHTKGTNFNSVSSMLGNSFVTRNFRDKIKIKFVELIEKAKRMENLFYLDMGIAPGPEAARQFSQKYLLLGDLDKDSEIIKKIGLILNTQNFRNILLGAYGYEEIFHNTINKIIKENRDNIRFQNSADFKEIVALNGYELVAKILSYNKKDRNLILTSAGLPNRSKALSGKLNSPTLNKYILDNLKINKANITQELKDSKELDSTSKKLINYAKEYFIQELIKLDVNNDLAIKLGNNLKTILKDVLAQTENRIGEVDIFTSTKGATGFIAELVWGFNPKLTGIESKVIGKKTNEKGKKIGSDIQITGKSGKTYFLQSKNTFYSRGPLFSGGGKLDTILSQLQKTEDLNYTEDEINLIKYNLINGKVFNNVDALKKVSTLLNQGILHFLRIESFHKLEKNFTSKQINAANLFYIYKGTYLIPISDFFETVVKLMDNLEGLYTINLSDIKLTHDEESLSEEKEEVKENFPSNLFGPFPLGSYGKQMMQVGRKAGREVSSSVEITNIKIIAKQIEKLLQQASLE